MTHAPGPLPQPSAPDVTPTVTPAVTIAISVNGEPYAAASGATVQDVLISLGLAGRPLAVEVNERVVPRAALAGCMLEAGDRVEIVTLVGGG